MLSDLLEWLNDEILDPGKFTVSKYNDLEIIMALSPGGLDHSNDERRQ